MAKQTPAEKVLAGYLEAALFTATAGEDDPSGLDDGDPLDKEYSVSDFSDESVKKAAKTVEKFLKAPGVEDAIALANELGYPDRGTGEYSQYEQIGHDLWMTEGGHGVGFWDGDYGDDKEEPAKTLTAAAGRHEGYVYVGDDKQLYLG